ncbi:MAG: hypothetical protein R2764_19565 [Bacteroidales bacterium]
MFCKQELEDKADSVHIFVTTDSSLKWQAPRLLTEVLLPDGKARYEWRTNQMTNLHYLIAFAISDYHGYSIYAKPENLINDSIWVLNYVYDYPNCLESNKTSIDQTADMIEFFRYLDCILFMKKIWSLYVVPSSLLWNGAHHHEWHALFRLRILSHMNSDTLFKWIT